MRNATPFLIYGAMLAFCIIALYWLFNQLEQPAQVMDKLPGGVYTSTINGHTYIISTGTGIIHDESCPNPDHVKPSKP